MKTPKDRDGKHIEDMKPVLQSGTLWSKILQRTEHAINQGALQCIPTRYEFIPHGHVRFLVRIIDDFASKRESKKAKKEIQETQKKFDNPFLPYEKDLFVANLSETHIAILNKFNVVDHHLLIITRIFEQQESPLTLYDFEAMWTCLNEFDGLAFYNSGPASGSSQPHKHLQMIPLPMLSGEARIPTEALITAGLDHDEITFSPALPFAHAVTRIPPFRKEETQVAATHTLEHYLAMRRIMGIDSEGEQCGQAGRPYNLLVTKRWILLVPRREECFKSISINALGFAGALLVRGTHQMQVLINTGPMRLLQHVAKPR